MSHSISYKVRQWRKHQVNSSTHAKLAIAIILRDVPARDVSGAELSFGMSTVARGWVLDGGVAVDTGTATCVSIAVSGRDIGNVIVVATEDISPMRAQSDCPLDSVQFISNPTASPGMTAVSINPFESSTNVTIMGEIARRKDDPEDSSLVKG